MTKENLEERVPSFRGGVATIVMLTLIGGGVGLGLDHYVLGVAEPGKDPHFFSYAGTLVGYFTGLIKS